MTEPRIRDAGDAAIIVELGEGIDTAINARAVALAARLRDDVVAGPALRLVDHQQPVRGGGTPGPVGALRPARSAIMVSASVSSAQPTASSYCLVEYDSGSCWSKKNSIQRR